MSPVQTAIEGSGELRPRADAHAWRTYAGLAFLSAGVLVLILVALASAAGGLSHYNDFYREAWQAYRALLHGHVVLFIQRGPAYVGSLILRAPFAFIPSIWGGSWRSVYVATALPCLVVAPILFSWILFDRRLATPTPNSAGVMLLGTLSPPLVMTILGGHPEEVLGAVLCVAAVIAAHRGRAGWCTVLLGLAVINKSWAIVALPVALVALPHRRLRTAGAVLGLAGAVVVAVTLIQDSSSGGGSAVVGTGIGTIFNPAQLFWWLGRGSFIAQHARFVIVGLPFVAAAAWWRRSGSARSGSRQVRDVLLLLALALLLRAALDPWDNLYYHLPFLMTLLAYEAHTRRWPILTLVYSVLLAFVAPVGGLSSLAIIFPVHWLAHPTRELQAAAYAIVVVPMLLWLSAKLFLSPHASRSGAARAETVRPTGPGRSTDRSIRTSV